MISSFLRTMIWVTASLSEHHLHLHQTHAKRENWGREVCVWIEQWNLEKHSFLPPAFHSTTAATAVLLQHSVMRDRCMSSSASTATAATSATGAGPL
uniref:Putative secreted protein n=1 Tax=Anopheles darlingi TaxID=43151 RepID=A0A2M4DAV0_ANODA